MCSLLREVKNTGLLQPSRGWALIASPIWGLRIAKGGSQADGAIRDTRVWFSASDFRSATDSAFAMGRLSFDRRLQQAVDGLYEAVIAPETWADALGHFDLLFGANSAHIFLWDDVENSRVAAHRSHSFADNHPEWDYFHRLNPRREILRNLPYGTPMNCADHIDNRTVSRSEFFTDYSLPAGRRFLLGTYAYKEGSVTTAFAVMRAPGQKAFDSSDTALLAHLMPHLRRAARIDRRMRAAQHENKAIGAVLDRLADAVFVVDESGRIMRSNAAANRMLETSNLFKAQAGRLRTAREHETAQLVSLIGDAARPVARIDVNSGGTMVLDLSGSNRWVVVVAPLMPSATVFDLSDRRLVLVLASKLTVTDSVGSRLRHAFALTPAEARLAGRIVAGETLEEVSAQLDVRVTTLRTQLKSVFHKTDTRRQGELMQLGALLSKTEG